MKKQRDATLLINDLYYPLVSSICFGLSPVHHQDHHLMKCITYWYVRAGESSCCVDLHPHALYSLWDDAPDDGLVIVRNMYSQIMDNKDHLWEVLHLVGLSTHWNMMYGTYNVKKKYIVAFDGSMSVFLFPLYTMAWMTSKKNILTRYHGS